MNKTDTYWFVSPVEREAFRKLEAENEQLREALRAIAEDEGVFVDAATVEKVRAALGDTEHE